MEQELSADRLKPLNPALDALRAEVRDLGEQVRALVEALTPFKELVVQVRALVEAMTQRKEPPKMASWEALQVFQEYYNGRISYEDAQARFRQLQERVQERRERLRGERR